MMRERYGGSYSGGGDRGDFEQRNAPVNVGDELEVTIEAVGEKGDGLAKKDGFVLFVPNTKKGERVKVKVTRVLKKVGFAEVVGQAEGASEEKPSGQEQAERSSEAPAESESSEESSYEDSEDFGEDENA